MKEIKKVKIWDLSREIIGKVNKRNDKNNSKENDKIK